MIPPKCWKICRRLCIKKVDASNKMFNVQNIENFPLTNKNRCNTLPMLIQQKQRTQVAFGNNFYNIEKFSKNLSSIVNHRGIVMADLNLPSMNSLLHRLGGARWSESPTNLLVNSSSPCMALCGEVAIHVKLYHDVHGEFVGIHLVRSRRWRTA